MEFSPWIGASGRKKKKKNGRPRGPLDYGLGNGGNGGNGNDTKIEYNGSSVYRPGRTAHAVKTSKGGNGKKKAGAGAAVAGAFSDMGKAIQGAAASKEPIRAPAVNTTVTSASEPSSWEKMRKKGKQGRKKNGNKKGPVDERGFSVSPGRSWDEKKQRPDEGRLLTYKSVSPEPTSMRRRRRV